MNTDTPIEHAVQIMITEKVKKLPVMEKEGEKVILVGILSMTDIARIQPDLIGSFKHLMGEDAARATMNLTSDAYLSYLLDQTETYLKLMLPDSQWIKFNKGKFALVEQVLKPEVLIACRVQFEGRWHTHSF